jgi:SnoaL-like protein
VEADMNDFAVNDDDAANLDIRASLDKHWKATDAGNLDAGHKIYHADAVLDYPQTGERIAGLANIRDSRAADPDRAGIQIRSIIGQQDLWVTEYTTTYSGEPELVVSMMEFRDGKVVRETQYVTEPFAAPPWRVKWRNAKS